MARLLSERDGMLRADSIARILIQPMVLAGLEMEPEDQELIRTRSTDIERHLSLVLARHGAAIVIDWDEDPGRAGARGLLAITVGGKAMIQACGE